MNNELLNKLADLYISLLNNREVVNPPVMISFSGIPGSDKTALAKRLAKDLKAQWLQHEDMRHLIAMHGYDPRRFSMVLLTRTLAKKIIQSETNKLIVLDLSIDRTWERFFDYAQNIQAKPIIIRINVPIEVLRKKLSERSDTLYISPDRFEGYVMDFENSKKHVVADFELDQDFNYDELLIDIKKRIG
jgi:predicted kinase